MSRVNRKRSVVKMKSDHFGFTNAIPHFGKYVLCEHKGHSSKWKVTNVMTQNPLVTLESVKIDIKLPFQLNDYI